MESGCVSKNASRSGEAGKRSRLKLGVTINFEGVHYLVDSNTERRKKASLLKDVSGFFNPSQMAALMGPSGSGKTTLLDVLAGRKTTGEIQGSIAFAGHQPSPKFLKRYTGYVEQFDSFLDVLNVEEMLMYTAELKRPMTESIADKKAEVEFLLEKLALTTARHTLIGNALNRGISGGQAKRLNIGIALITDPHVLFLDEPTTGLDSYTANEVMSYVKKFASDGVTICATIHSPSPYAYSLFDRVMMLVGGEVVYFGDRGRAQPYFQALQPEASMTMINEAEWLTDIIVKADREKKGPELSEAYRASELMKENEISQRNIKGDDDLDPEILKALSVKHSTVTPFWFALKVLLKYRTLRNYKNPDFLGPRIGDKIIFSILMGTLYFGIGDDFSQGNLVNLNGVLFMWAIMPAYGAVTYVPSIVLERALFIREQADGLYQVITYLCAKMLEELILTGFVSLIFGMAIFLMVDLQGSFLVFWIAYFLTLVNGIVMAYVVAAFSPTMDFANAALPAYLDTVLLLSGFTLRFADIPAYYSWYTRITFVRYSWSAIMINQFDGQDQDLMIDEDGNPISILDFYGLNYRSIGANLGILCAFGVSFFTIAFLGMKFMRHSSR